MSPLGPTENLEIFTEVQELFKQLGEADLDNWSFFVGINNVFCGVSAFCFFLGGEELKVVETGNVGKKPKDDERCISMMYGFESCCEVLFNGFELIEAIPRPLITTDAH